jgi:thiol-disulfide isomerase/thioredoxin
MRKITLLLAALLPALGAFAQDYAALDRYMRKYFGNFNTQTEQTGQPMPDFYFDKKLNSKALKGKFLVLDFWATWCGGCRILSHEIDSAFYKNKNPYTAKNVQFIGVDCKDDQEKATKYWNEKQYGFPSAFGAAADSCGKSINNGFPTYVLIDDKGIVRARWDAWTSASVRDIEVALWALTVLPKSGITASLDNAEKLSAAHQPLKALYLLEQMPQDENVQLAKLDCMAQCLHMEASIYGRKLLALHAGNPALTARVSKVMQDRKLKISDEMYEMFSKHPKYINL